MESDRVVMVILDIGDRKGFFKEMRFKWIVIFYEGVILV